MDDHYRRHPDRASRRGRPAQLSAGAPVAVPSDGFRGAAPYGRHPLDEKPLVLPAALRRHHTAVGDQSADLRVQLNHRAGRRRLGRSGGHVKRLVARRRSAVRSNVWDPPRAASAPAARRRRGTVPPPGEPLQRAATPRRDRAARTPVAARRRRVTGRRDRPRTSRRARRGAGCARPETRCADLRSRGGVPVRRDENHMLRGPENRCRPYAQPIPSPSRSRCGPYPGCPDRMGEAPAARTASQFS